MNTERCIPCELVTAAGLLIGKYCNADKNTCKKFEHDFLNGKLTLKQLGDKLNADKELMDYFAKETELDKTMSEVQ